MMRTVSSRAEPTSTAFRAEDPDQARARREQLALARIAERHPGPEAAGPGPKLAAQEAIRRVTAPAPTAETDTTDLLAALTLLPRAQADLEALEAGLLFLARERGMTWAEIAFGLGLRSAQAAQQRGERSISRMEDRSPDPQLPTESDRKG